MQPGEAIIIRRSPNDPIAQLFKLEKRKRPFLLGIFEYAYRVGVQEPELPDLLIAAGINGYTQEDMQQAGTYAPNKGNLGGHTTPLRPSRDREGKRRIVIFIRQNEELNGTTALRAKRDLICGMLLFHELQHADDQASDKFAIGQIDNVKMEFDAHCAALRAAKERCNRAAAGFYLASLHQHLKSGVPNYVAAATQLIDGPRYKEYLEFAGATFEPWNRDMNG